MRASTVVICLVLAVALSVPAAHAFSFEEELVLEAGDAPVANSSDAVAAVKTQPITKTKIGSRKMLQSWSYYSVYYYYLPGFSTSITEIFGIWITRWQKAYVGTDYYMYGFGYGGPKTPNDNRQYNPYYNKNPKTWGGYCTFEDYDAAETFKTAIEKPAAQKKAGKLGGAKIGGADVPPAHQVVFD